MAVFVDKSVTDRLRGNRSAINRLDELVRLVAEGRNVPRTFLKASGEGRKGKFEGYVTLNLWHAKLDGSGRNQGDPLLVMQQDGNGDYQSVALSNHEEYATVDEATCRAWLWRHRENIDWTISSEARALLQSLEDEFDVPGITRKGR